MLFNCNYCEGHLTLQVVRWSETTNKEKIYNQLIKRKKGSTQWISLNCGLPHPLQNSHFYFPVKRKLTFLFPRIRNQACLIQLVKIIFCSFYKRKKYRLKLWLVYDNHECSHTEKNGIYMGRGVKPQLSPLKTIWQFQYLNG